MFDEWRATALAEKATGEKVVDVPGRPASLVGSEGVRYTSSFADPREASDDVAVLELRGLYAHSEVEVTGDRVDGEGPVEHDAYFRPLRIPFEPYEQNELTVTCHAPHDRFGGLHDTEMVPEEDAVPGIWWGASLESHSLPYIDNIDVEPELTDDGATLHLRTTVVADEMLEERITYSIKPAGDTKSRGMMQRARVETDGPGKTVLEHTVDVHDPALWWPRELGQQNRYEVRAKLGDTEYTVTTGICDIEAEESRLSVNGESLSIRGVNLLTAADEDIDRALSCNANLVRAHAHVLPDELYQRCDEEGLLVWQDLPLTGPGEFDVDRGKELARTLDYQYSRHPSLAATTAHDDPVDPFAAGLGSGLLDRLRFRYRAWRSSYDYGSAEAVAEALPDQRPAYPVVGGPGIDSDAGSYYPGWSYGDADDIAGLLDRYPVPVVAEFGAASLGNTTAGEDIHGFNVQKHDRYVSGEIEQSQSYQREVVRSIAECLRHRKTGAIAFALRDTDVAGFGVYTQNGEPKSAASALERAFSPLQAFLVSPGESESELVVVNDTPREHTAELRYEAGDVSETFELTVGGRDRWTADSVEVPDTATAISLGLTVGEHSIENTYER